jgi:hypothetical protein
MVSETESVAEAFFIVCNIRSRVFWWCFFKSEIVEVGFRVGDHDQIHFCALVPDLKRCLFAEQPAAATVAFRLPSRSCNKVR